MNNAEWRALQWCRTSHTGRQLQKYILARIQEARDVYEREEANEDQRLLLAAYKDMYGVLFTTDIKELN